MSVPEIRPTAINTAGAMTASFGTYTPAMPLARTTSPPARDNKIARTGFMRRDRAIVSSPSQALSLGTYWKLSAAPRMKSKTRRVSRGPRGIEFGVYPTIEGPNRSAASSDQATPEPLSPAVDSVRRAHRRRRPFGARRHPTGQSRVRGGGRAVRGPWSSRRLARVRGNRLDGDHGRDQVEGFGSHAVRLRPSRRVGPARRAHRPRNGPHATHRIGPSFPQCRSLPRAVARSPHPPGRRRRVRSSIQPHPRHLRG